MGDRLQLALEHHIVDFRTSIGSHGQITAVKHIKRGWITLKEYYDLQKVHEALPIIEKIIEGGYRLKQTIYGLEVEVEAFGFGVSIPVGVALLLATTASAAALWEAGDKGGAVTLLSLLVLPFGELVLLYLFAHAIFKGAESVAPILPALPTPLPAVINGYATGGVEGALLAAKDWFVAWGLIDRAQGQAIGALAQS